MAATQLMIESPRHSRIGVVVLLGYLGLYAGFLAAMHRVGRFEVSEPLLILAIIGIGFSVAAWLFTIRVTPLEYAIVNPTRELAIIGLFLLLAIVFITWGLGMIHRYIPSGPANAFVILVAKLALFFVLPAAMLHAQFGYGLRRLAPISLRRGHVFACFGMAALLVLFQAVFGRGLRDILNAHLPASTLLCGLPFAFVWMVLEAGVVEEFFFRVLLQTRLAATLKSEVAGIILASLIFGLAHAPGFYLRTSLTQEPLVRPSLLMAVGYSIVVTSVTGFFLGVLWSRTRNFAVVVIVHAAGDLLPNLLPTLHAVGVSQ